MSNEWLVETFFKPADEKMWGWKNIATKLVETGECLTTEGAQDIWHGGVGNFIQIEPSNEGVGLVKMTFNKKQFVSEDCPYFMEVYQNKLNSIAQEILDLQNYEKSLKDLLFSV